MRLFAFSVLVRKHDSDRLQIRSIPLLIAAGSDKEALIIARQEAAKKFPGEGWTMKASIIEIEQSKLLETLHENKAQVVPGLT